MSRERSLLFGLLAVRHGKVSAAHLAEAVQENPVEADADLGGQLVAMGALSAQDRDAVDRLLEKAVRAYAGDPVTTLASLSGMESLVTLSASTTGSAEARKTAAGSAVPGEATGEPVPAVHEQTGHYTELREFAVGGMGRILLVHDEHLDRDIALKQLLPEKAGLGGHTGAPTADLLTVPIIARFLQEARITGQLEHPAIVPVYELGYRDDGSLYYTMKLVRGRTLQEAIKKALSLRERLLLLTHFLDLCQAIAYAHSRGVIHRDLKPLNVMIGEFGETVVIDWGIAKVRGTRDIHAKNLAETVRAMHVGDAESTAKTVYGQTLGSPFYMPPEQAAGRMEAIDERSDIYALGAVLYAILAGNSPYHGNRVAEFIEKVDAFPPKPIRDSEPEAPAELVAVCERAMARTPEDRYPSAKALAEEVQRYLAGGLVNAYDYRLSELFRRFVRKHRTLLTTSGLALAALLVLGVFSYVRVSHERDRAVVAEHLAVQAWDVAETEKTRAQQRLYYANVALVQRSIGEQQMAQARALLGECPPTFRDWEWGHLQYLCHRDLMTLREGGRYVAFAREGAGLMAGKANGTVTLCDGISGAVLHTFVEKAGFGYALAHSADGGRLAVSGDAATVVWDVASGEELFRFDEAAAAERLHQVALSADGSRLAVLHADRSVGVWDVGVGEPLLSVPTGESRSTALRLSPSGARLLVVREAFGVEGWVRTMEVLTLPAGEQAGISELQDPLSVHAAVFSPDGGVLAVATDEGLQVWGVNPWEKRYEFEGRFRYPGTIAFSPDGAWVAGGDKDGHLGLWTVEDGEGVRVAKAHQDAIRGVAFSPNGKALATISEDRTVRLWDLPLLRPLQVLRGHDKSVFSLAFSLDGKTLATGSFDGRTKLWDVGAELDSAPVQAVALHPETGLLAGGLGNDVGLWDSRNGHRLRTLEGHRTPVFALAFGAAGAQIAAVSHRADEGSDWLCVWDTASGASRWSTAIPKGTQELVLGGAYVVVRSGSALSMRDAETGAEQWPLSGVDSFALDTAGKYLAASAAGLSDAGAQVVTVTLWDLATRTEIAAFPVSTGFSAKTAVRVTLAFSPDAGHLLAGVQVRRDGDAVKGIVYTWNVAEASAGPTLEGHKAAVTCLAYNEEGTVLATGAKDGAVLLWDMPDGTLRLSLEGHASDIRDLAFSPGGTRLVTASQDGTFKLWDTANGREILTLQAAARNAAGQVVAPDQVAFRADGGELFTLTRPVFPPMVLHAFPWQVEAYPGEDDAPFEVRVERFKRARRP